MSESLQRPVDSLTRKNMHLLTGLTHTMQVTLQWILAHRGIWGNQHADTLAKAGSRLEQPKHPISFRDAKVTLLFTMTF